MARKITSREDLKALRDQARAEIDLRSGPKDIRVTVHMGTCGIAAGARDVLGQLVDELGPETPAKVTVGQSGCFGLCDQEPMLTVTDQKGAEYLYGRLDRDKVREIVRQHILGGQPVNNYIVREKS